MIKSRSLLLSLGAALALLSAQAEEQQQQQPGVSPGPGTRYATDCYPGFDNVDEAFKPEKKVPRWFAWINGPKMSNAKDQFAWCQQCEREEAWRSARRGYDALVREWPTAPEAPKAQLRLAEIWLEKYLDYEEAFVEYRYLVDFYPLECDFDAIAKLMFQTVELMREEGKTILFFRFKNTSDVRRAYESLVLRSAGADFVRGAMLTIAQLREDECQYEKAVIVYENLRNLYPKTPEARTALYREGAVRMKLLDIHAYNRARVTDTIAFLKMARREDLTPEWHADFDAWFVKACNHLADEAWRAAQFYDSRTRTTRSAINAYERFVEDYPKSPHVQEALDRLAKLKEKDNAQRKAQKDRRDQKEPKDQKEQNEKNP